MATVRSDGLYRAAQDAQQKFDYFVLGIVGAMCAFIGQSFQPERLGFNPGTVEFIALLMLVASAVAGFRRIETCNSLIRSNGNYLRMQEERGGLTKIIGSPMRNDATGEVYSSEQVIIKIQTLEETIPIAQEMMDKIGRKTLFYYKARNWLLIFGFLLLLCSKILRAYV